MIIKNTSQKYNIIVGIDPDVDKSGVAVLDVKTRKMTLQTLDLPSLVRFAQQLRNKCREEKKTLVAIVEASWKNSAHNWHTKDGDNGAVLAKKGYHVGRNHQVGQDICAMLRAIGVDVVEKTPLRKIWKGENGKITHKEFTKLTGITTSRTNQEMRDAGLLAWMYSGCTLSSKLSIKQN